jgi:hypothetical protein
MVKDSAKNLSGPWRSANLEMPDGTVVHNDKMIFWVPVPWDGRGGRVSLAGDACHPLPPRKSPLPNKKNQFEVKADESRPWTRT